MPSNEQIKKDVTDQLYWDSRVDAGQIDVSVDNGIVGLDGSVPTFRAMEAAREDAITVNGVVSVMNNLSVKHPDATDLPTDDETRSHVEHALRVNPDVDSTEIIVSVEEGKVKLEGSVPVLWQKLNAESTAEGMPGVTKIINNLVVTPTDDITDKIIADDIMRALDRSASIESEHIHVTVEDGIASLKGAVPNMHTYDRALNIAYYTRGVVDVEDQLDIDSGDVINP